MTTVTYPDGTTVTTTVTANGQTVTVVPGPNTPAANSATLQARAQLALDANATFLALASPTNAQTLAQVQTLTKECNGLIRLLLNLLDSTTGT
jgi:hypothetical protein